MQETKRHGFDHCFGTIPWRRKWQSTPVFLPGESHRQRKLEGLQSMGSLLLQSDCSLTTADDYSQIVLNRQHTHTFNSPLPLGQLYDIPKCIYIWCYGILYIRIFFIFESNILVLLSAFVPSFTLLRIILSRDPLQI